MDTEYSIYSAHMARNALRLLRPHHAIEAQKIRIGRPFDGGYVMIDAFDQVEAAYSFGINDDVSWDFDIAQRGIDIFQYDHTIEHLPFEHPRFHWSKTGIDRTSSGNMRSLPDVIKAHGHENATNLLLKCDIELAEWDAFHDVPKIIMEKFSQIVIEIHDLPRVGSLEHGLNARQVLMNLTNNHRLVHIHANNYGGFRMVGGIMLPNVVELTLIRKDMFDLSVSNEIFPTNLDMPCNRDWADIHLGNFAFD